MREVPYSYHKLLRASAWSLRLPTCGSEPGRSPIITKMHLHDLHEVDLVTLGIILGKKDLSYRLVKTGEGSEIVFDAWSRFRCSTFLLELPWRRQTTILSVKRWDVEIIPENRTSKLISNHEFIFRRMRIRGSIVRCKSLKADLKHQQQCSRHNSYAPSSIFFASEPWETYRGLKGLCYDVQKAWGSAFKYLLRNI